MTVLMVPFIMVCTMTVVQFGLAAYARQVVAGAAQDGAAHGALDGSSPADGLAVTDRLITTSGGSIISGHSSSVSASAEQITITAQADVVRLVPLFPAITVRASSSASIERFVAPEGS